MPSESRSAVRSATRWTVVASVAGAVLLLIFNLLLTRLAEPAAVGQVFAMLSMAAVLTNIVQFGLHTTALRVVSTEVGNGDLDTARGLARRIVVIVMTNGGLLCILVGLAYLTFPARVDSLFGGSTLMGAALAYSVFTGVRMTLVTMDRAFEHNARAALAGNVFPMLLQVVCLFLAVVLMKNASTVVLLAAVVFSQFIALMMSVILTRNEARGGTIREGYHNRDLYWSGALFFVNALVFSAFSQLGVLYVFHAGAPEDVALFGLAARLMLAANTPIVMFTQFLSPIIARELRKEQRGDTNEVLQTGSNLAFLYGVVVFVVLLVFGKSLIELLFGTYYTASWLSLIILLGGQALSYFVGFGIRALQMAGWQKVSLLPGLLTLAIAFLMVHVLYPPFGIVGVAISISAALVAGRLLSFFLARRLLGVTAMALRLATLGPLLARMRKKKP